MNFLAGKQTEEDNGQIMLQHVEVPKLERKKYVSLVDHMDCLFDNQSAKEQLEFACKMQHESTERAGEIFENFGLATA